MEGAAPVEGVMRAPAGRLAWLVIALVVVPTLFSIELLTFAIHHGNAFGDFVGSLWRPGHVIRCWLRSLGDIATAHSHAESLSVLRSR